MRFTKKDTISLIETFGRAYYNPALSIKNKESFLKIIQQKFPAWTMKEIGDKLDQMHKKYLSCKMGGNKKWEFYDVIDKVVNLANKDYMPKRIEVVLSEDSEDDYLKGSRQEEEPKEVTASKKRSIDDIDGTSPKRIKIDHDIVGIPKCKEEKDCQVNDQNMAQSESVDKKIADFQKILKNTEDNFKIMIDDLRSMITTMKNDLFIALNNKEKDKRINETYLMSKTYLNEQKETNDMLYENQTILKSVIGGQKVQYDFIARNYDILRKIYDLIVPETIEKPQ